MCTNNSSGSHPTTKGINSSKSNNLPDWKVYFPRLCQLEFLSYTMIWEHDSVHMKFEKYAREYLNNDDVNLGTSIVDFLNNFRVKNH